MGSIIASFMKNRKFNIIVSSLSMAVGVVLTLVANSFIHISIVYCLCAVGIAMSLVEVYVFEIVPLQSRPIVFIFPSFQYALREIFICDCLLCLLRK